MQSREEAARFLYSNNRLVGMAKMEHGQLKFFTLQEIGYAELSDLFDEKEV